MSVFFLISFVIFFKGWSYIGIFQTSWKRRTWQRIVKIMIHEQCYDIFVSFHNSDLYVRSLRCFFRSKFIYFIQGLFKWIKVLKLNFGLFILEVLYLIQIILGWPLHFSTEAFTLSAHKLEVWSSKQGSFGSDRFLTILQKYLLKVSAIYLSFWRIVSFSTKLIISLCLSLSEKSGLTVCQNF